MTATRGEWQATRGEWQAGRPGGRAVRSARHSRRAGRAWATSRPGDGARRRSDDSYGGAVSTGRSKQQWRADVATRRRARSGDERAGAADALAAGVLALPELASAATVAAYASYPSEPGTTPLRQALRDRGVRVLLPVLLADKDLDWVSDAADPERPRPGRLGVGAIATADVVVCPATAVALDGTRLGKGGGSYDRALAVLRPGTLVVALVHDDEVVADLPAEPHDRPVDVVVTPTRTLRPRAGARTVWPPHDS